SRNLAWSWCPEARALWDGVAGRASPRRRDELRRNPASLLASLGERATAALDEDRDLRRLLGDAESALRRLERSAKPPFSIARRSPVAYFSMEFGLHESVPIYAGGLGILAGDHLKSASDLGLPLVGVGLFYHRGYFRQAIDGKGRQKVIYPRARCDLLPLEAVRDGARGEDLRIPVDLAGRTISARAWKVQVGSVPLYLLDTDVPENRPADRRITDKLYGGSREDRIRQEIVAGVGGVRLLRALGIRPSVWHLNEGHVAFLTLERLRELSESTDLGFEEACEVIAGDTVFTTHTPVPEGNEVFDLALADRYLRPLADAAGVRLEDYLALGLDSGAKGRRVLSLTVLALRLSRFRGGVSRLHGDVSRRMWSKLWPGFRAEEVPIGSVTNGIHTPTWIAPQFDRLLRESIGPDWTARLADPHAWKAVEKIPGGRIWKAKQELKEDLVRFVRRRTAERLLREGAGEKAVFRVTESLLDPEALTIGFARRFALYKRAALIFRDLRRAEALFGSKRRPVQIIFAGKPHPEDPAGARIFEAIEAISRRPRLRGRVVLLENYDVEVARHMVQGVDIWLNNPRRPLEASGTSGEKVPASGGLNLSILDGWWCEGYAPGTGFAFGKSKEYEDETLQDRDDHAALYRALEREVLPAYYERNSRGLPARWLRLVKSSMARLVPRFSTHRMVLEYARDLYEPAAENGRLLRSGDCRVARDLAALDAEVRRAWPLVHVRSASRVRSRAKRAKRPGRPARRGGARRVDTGAPVEVEVYLAGLSPGHLGCVSSEGELLPIETVRPAGEGTWRLRIRAPEGGTCRLFPLHPEQAHPQELGLSVEFDV
ncbi:MAG: alpha-glucan family phosphorylase, partial [Planctomycetes bacterium]|nr:alpha-glucan family phosphorylase [Planctomycetota bacterium]